MTFTWILWVQTHIRMFVKQAVCTQSHVPVTAVLECTFWASNWQRTENERYKSMILNWKLLFPRPNLSKLNQLFTLLVVNFISYLNSSEAMTDTKTSTYKIICMHFIIFLWIWFCVYRPWWQTWQYYDFHVLIFHEKSLSEQ